MNKPINCKCNITTESADCERTFLPNDMAVTMAYVPFQLDLSHYCPADALRRGTLFTDLDKPFKGRCVS